MRKETERQLEEIYQKYLPHMNMKEECPELYGMCKTAKTILEKNMIIRNVVIHIALKIG